MATPAGEGRRQRRWLDASRPLVTGMPVWPGDPPVAVTRVLAREAGDACQVSTLATSVHAGTHVDAPCHYLEGGAGVEAMPPWVCIGLARVVRGVGSSPLASEALLGLRVGRGQRLLFAGGGADGALSLAAARFLARRRVALVGTDAPSVGPPGEEGDEVHRVLLASGAWILEGLVLEGVRAGRYEFVCAPLLLPGADGAPARVFLRPR